MFGSDREPRHRFYALRGDLGKDGRSRCLPLDAFYPTLNLIVEYDERQHTEAIAFFDRKVTISGVSRGLQRKKYDAIKRAYPALNKMHIVVFSYRDFPHNSSKRLLRRASDRELIRLRLLHVTESQVRDGVGERESMEILSGEIMGRLKSFTPSCPRKGSVPEKAK